MLNYLLQAGLVNFQVIATCHMGSATAPVAMWAGCLLGVVVVMRGRDGCGNDNCWSMPGHHRSRILYPPDEDH
eukprot:12799401-Ditylum_brightwellii.AAC.1